MEVSGQFHVPAALSPGKEPPEPLDRRLGGEEKILLLPLPGNEDRSSNP